MAVKIHLPDGTTFADLMPSEIARVVLHLLQDAAKTNVIPAKDDKGHEYNMVTAHYTGSGDSTDSMEWSLHGDSGADSLGLEWDNDPGDVVDEWIWQLSTEASPGWYNNEGGYGELVVNFKTGVVTFDHYNYVMETTQEANDVLVNIPGEQLERESFENLPSGTTFHPDGRVELPEDDTDAKFVNYYTCPQCGHKWNDVWSAQCDDDCPACNTRHISPTHSEDA